MDRPITKEPSNKTPSEIDLILFPFLKIKNEAFFFL
jgi:hypothetical protein